MPGHTNMGNLASLPLKCISQLPESLERGWKAHYFFIHGLLICLIDLPFVFIRPEANKREVIQSKGSFMQCITGGPPMDSSNSMNEGGSIRKAGFLYEDSKRKRIQPYISYGRICDWMRNLIFCGLTLPPSEMRETSIGGSQSMKILPFLTCNSPLSVSIQYLIKWTFL